MLQSGIIRQSDSPWSAPVVLVPKKSVGGETKYRFCTDYRVLNAVTKADVYPLPNITETLDGLGRYRYFTTLDLASGYHQIPLAIEDIEKTTFPTPDDHYEYTQMPFGFSRSPATFQRAMGHILAGLRGGVVMSI